nr:hypothetical protein [Desulfovibrio sp.]
TPFAVVRFPDGTVMAEPFREKQWPSLEAFEQETCTRPRHVVRWHPAPEGEEELAQASTVMEAVKVLARRLAEHGLFPDDPALEPLPREATDGLAKLWTEEAFRILWKQARAVAQVERCGGSR